MPDIDREFIRRSFVSERRNLLLTSIVLFLALYSGIVFDDINILGNKATLKDPSLIPTLLWIFWGYFFLRYYQHFRQAHDHAMARDFYAALNRKCIVVAKNKFETAFVASSTYEGMDKWIIFTNQSVSSLTRTRALVSLTGQIAYGSSPGSPIHEDKTEVIELSLKEMILPNIKAVLHLCFTSVTVLEFILPFLVALLPLIYVLIKLSLSLTR